MRTKGRITHCEVFFLAGQRNATKGNAGLCVSDPESDKAISLLVVGGGSFFFLLALYGGAEAAILVVTC